MINEDWFSVYGENISPNTGNTKFRERQGNFGTGNIYVFNCEFYKCESANSRGGAIFVSSVQTTKALFEKCSFFKCKTTNSNYEGAAIWFGKEGNCVISQVCGYGCYSANYYSFSYICSTDDVNYKNCIEDSSISFSESLGSITLCHDYGKNLVNRINCSSNINNRNTIYCIPTSSSDVNGYILFCSFVNNTVIQNRIITNDNPSTSYLIASCNVLNNKQEDFSTYGIVLAYGNMKIDSSCIQGNIAKYTFYEHGSGYHITVTNCVLVVDVESKIYNGVTIENKVSGSFIVHLVHLSKGECRMKKAFITSCLNNKKQTVDALRFLMFVFLLNFLPSNPSKDIWYDILFGEEKA